MKRIAALAYGTFSYLVFLATFVYSIGFIGNLFVPKSIDTPREGSLWVALAVDLGLLTVFALQHSVMARPAFKRRWTRIVSPAIERSTYVLFSSLALILMYGLWRPLGGSVWNVDALWGQAALYGAYAFGWALVFVSTCLIHHFDLFGMRQVWLYFRGRPYTELPFGTPGLYRLVRHPLYVGWLFVMWATPTMTVTHALFALTSTVYILGAVQLEERDLIATFGERYQAYRRNVPMLLPSFGRRSADVDARA